MPEKQAELEYEPSLEEDINAAIDQVAGKDYDPQEEDTLEADVAAAIEASETESTEEPEETPDETPDEDEAGSEDGDDEPEEDEETGDEEPEQEDSGEESHDDLVAAPEHWPQEDRDAFVKMDKAGRDLVLEQNKRFERRHQAHSEQVRESEALREAFAPLEQQMQLAGIDRVTAINRLVAGQRLLMQEPENGLRWLAQEYGKTIRDKQAFVKSLATEMGVELQAGQEPEPPQYLDPRAQAEIERLNKVVTDLQSTQTASTEQANATAVQQAQAELTAFIAEKDDAGNLKHPHFERVHTKMAQLYQADPSRPLADLYNDAVMLDGELRQQIIDQQATEKAKANGKAERAKKAKKASRNVKGVRVGKPATEEMSVEESVTAAIEAWDQRASL